MRRIREAIEENRYEEFQKAFFLKYGSETPSFTAIWACVSPVAS